MGTIKVMFLQLIHTIIDYLSLDLLLYWRMSIKMNSSSTLNPIMELKNDKDVLWCLNLARNIRQ